MGRPPLKQAFTVCYEKAGIELQRYTITALTQLAAETEADNRFQRAHPELKIPDAVCVAQRRGALGRGPTGLDWRSKWPIHAISRGVENAGGDNHLIGLDGSSLPIIVPPKGTEDSPAPPRAGLLHFWGWSGTRCGDPGSGKLPGGTSFCEREKVRASARVGQASLGHRISHAAQARASLPARLRFLHRVPCRRC